MVEVLPAPTWSARFSGPTWARPATFLPSLGVAGLLIAWAALTAGAGVVPADVLPTPSDTFAAATSLVQEGEFWTGLRLTLVSWAVGLTVSAVIAIPAGVILASSERAFSVVRVPLEAMRPVPPIVVLPLALLVLGGGLTFKVVLIAQGALWPLLIQTLYGVRGVDPVTLDTARAFRFGRLRTLLRVQLPAASPTIVTALRLAAATAFAVCIVCELVGGASGTGNLLVLASSGNDLPRIFALTFVIGVVGLGIGAAFTAAERRLLHWSARQRR